MLLSGGIDSACLLADLTAQRAKPVALFVDYGQPVAEIERGASLALAQHFGAQWDEIAVSGLVPGTGEIVGRNALLAHLALTWLGDRKGAVIFVGIHAGTDYRDCSPDFIGETQCSLDFQSGGAVRISAPYVNWPKGLVIERALELGVPIELTHSCERSDTPCEECSSCLDRRTQLARS